MTRLLPVLLVAVLACERAERLAGDAEDRAHALLLERDEKEVMATLATVREVAAKAQSVELYRRRPAARCRLRRDRKSNQLSKLLDSSIRV